MSTGSLSAAAEKLHLSQPALSKQLAALEAAVNLRLFHRRSGGPMVPTREGIQLYKEIEGTLAGIAMIPQLARDIGQFSSTRLRLAATPPLINSRPLMRALGAFREQNPWVTLVLESRHRLDIETWIVSHQADVGLALLPATNPLLTAIPFIRTRAVAALSPGHPLAEKPHITLADLKDTALILPSRQPLRDKIDAVLNDAGSQRIVEMEASSAITCCRMASEGLGLSLCDPFSPTAFAPSQVTVRAFVPAIELSYGALIRNDLERGQIADRLIGLVQEQLSAMPFPPVPSPVAATAGADQG